MEAEGISPSREEYGGIMAPAGGYVLPHPTVQERLHTSAPDGETGRPATGIVRVDPIMIFPRSMW